MLTVLEALYDAKASLEHNDYVHQDWSHCTCGHIYRGAHGSFAERDLSLIWLSTDEVYKAALVAVVKANGQGLVDFETQTWVDWETMDVGRLTSAVSGMTHKAAGDSYDPTDESLRFGAIRMVDKAIAMIEAEDRAAMEAVRAERQLVLA